MHLSTVRKCSLSHESLEPLLWAAVLSSRHGVVGGMTALDVVPKLCGDRFNAVMVGCMMFQSEH
jgi:hypothetical protein